MNILSPIVYVCGVLLLISNTVLCQKELSFLFTELLKLQPSIYELIVSLNQECL